LNYPHYHTTCSRSQISALASGFCIALLIFAVGVLTPLQVSAGMISYTVDPSASFLTFSGTVLVPNPLGAGTLTLQIVDQKLLRPSGDLTTRLGGVFAADPVAAVLGLGGPISQLDAMQGRLFSGVTPVGQISIPLGTKLDFLLSNTGLLAFNGSVNYSTVPPFNSSGSFSLSGSNLSIGTPTFNGMTSVTTPISFSGPIPTGSNNFLLTGTFTGQITGIAAVPEPSSLMLSVLVGIGAFWRCRRHSKTKSPCVSSME